MSSERQIAIRLLGEADRAAVDRLAQRDSAAVPSGRLLGGWVDGRLVAARSLVSGDAIADPFQRSGDVGELLARRAAQLRGTGSRARRLGRRLFGRRSRGALPSSPPGAGGRILVLPDRY